ncbi:hypothetical protein D3C78_19370 [compost metagenome]
MDNIILITTIIYLVLINIVGVVLMYVDKSRAASKKWRIPEKTLLGVAIIGGSLGSTIGMRLFKHKTKHQKFNIGLPVIVLVHIAIIYLIKDRFL